MRKAFLIYAGLLLASLFMVAGCSEDEDCAICPVPQEGTVFAYTGLENGILFLFAVISDLEGLSSEVDSAKVGGVLAEVENTIGGMGSFSVVYHERSAGSISSGDNMDLVIYGPTGQSGGSTTLLDGNYDKPNIMGWNTDWPYDTVDIGTTIQVTWNAVDDADWYLISKRYDTYGPGDGNIGDNYMFLTDTSFAVPGSALVYDGILDLNIVAVSGPFPDEEQNVYGIYRGTMIGAAGDYFSIYIGDGPYRVEEEKDEKARRKELYQTLMDIYSR